jgi:hypothetical protein
LQCWQRCRISCRADDDHDDDHDDDDHDGHDHDGHDHDDGGVGGH